MKATMKTIKKPILVVILGPTGSGKTDLGIEIAQRLCAPIISTDSRQVYRGMSIGTAQPNAEQLSQVKHYFIADRNIEDKFTAGEFEKEALGLLDELFKVNRYVVAVGGSGLYIDALCDGLDDLPLEDKKIREGLQNRLSVNGLPDLLEQLKELDEEYYNRVDRDNPARIMRALEVCLVSGKPYSEQRKAQRKERNFDVIKIGVTLPREELYERINFRVDNMLAAGLEQEARALYPYRSFNSLQTVGYREFFDYFDGTIPYGDAVELIKRNSRRYAKRQLTWFNRDSKTEWFRNKDIDLVEILVKNFA